MLNLKNTPILVTLSIFMHLNAYALQTNGVVTTIKPLHSLVSGVIGDTGKATLLLKGAESPHGFQFKPSQMKKMQQAKVVFYIDNNLETFLSPALKVLPKTVKTVAVAKKSRIKLQAYRQGKDWEKESHNNEEEHIHNHGLYNMHIWLNPNNAIQMVKTIVKELSLTYPENRNIYKSNARKLLARIKTLDQKLKQQLTPVKDKPFIVFHDAYQYFEKAYGLKAVGSITVQPNQPLSPRRVSEIQQKLRTHQVQCIFSEPQFSDRIIHTIAKNSTTKTGILDSLGMQLEAGHTLYFNLLQNLANNIKQCLQ